MIALACHLFEAFFAFVFLYLFCPTVRVYFVNPFPAIRFYLILPFSVIRLSYRSAIVNLNPLASAVGYPSTRHGVRLFTVTSACVQHWEPNPNKIRLFRPFQGVCAPTVIAVLTSVTADPIDKAKLSVPINSGRAELRWMNRNCRVEEKAFDSALDVMLAMDGGAGMMGAGEFDFQSMGAEKAVVSLAEMARARRGQA